MIRLIIKKGNTWLSVFALAQILTKHLKLTRYDALKLAYTTLRQDVVVQSSTNAGLYYLHVDLHRKKFNAEIYDVHDLAAQLDLLKYAPFQCGMHTKGGKVLWKSNPKDDIYKENKNIVECVLFKKNDYLKIPL